MTTEEHCTELYVETYSDGVVAVAVDSKAAEVAPAGYVMAGYESEPLINKEKHRTSTALTRLSRIMASGRRKSSVHNGEQDSPWPIYYLCLLNQ